MQDTFTHLLQFSRCLYHLTLKFKERLKEQKEITIKSMFDCLKNKFMVNKYHGYEVSSPPPPKTTRKP